MTAICKIVIIVMMTWRYTWNFGFKNSSAKSSSEKFYSIYIFLYVTIMGQWIQHEIKLILESLSEK